MSEYTNLADVLENKNQPSEARVAAGNSILQKVGNISSDNKLSKIFCGIFQDEADDVSVRLLAVKALENCANVNHLTRVTKNPEVRLEAIAAMKRLGATTLPDRLLSDLEAITARLEGRAIDGSPSSTILNLPGTHGRDPDAMRLLDKCLISDNPEIRVEAIQSLTVLGEHHALTLGMSDPSAMIRSRAAELCPYFANGLLDETALALLRQLRQDSDPGVQKSATTALKRLGLQPKPQPRAEPKRIGKDGGAKKFDWCPLMERWSRLCLEDDDYVAELPDEVVEDSWLGYPGATVEEIAALEERLGLPLPPSYKEFLELTNGWRRLNCFMDNLWSSREVDFFRVKNQQWIDAFCDNDSLEVTEAEHLVYGDEQVDYSFRSEYLKTAIEISDTFQSAIVLLNPMVLDEEGEWEAWFFANWYPGAARYPSFWKLMHYLYKTACELGAV